MFPVIPQALTVYDINNRKPRKLFTQNSDSATRNKKVPSIVFEAVKLYLCTRKQDSMVLSRL